VAWDLWEHRNSILHNAQNVVTAQTLRSLNRQVSLAFTDLQSILIRPNDKHLLALKLSLILKKDNGYKEAWLRNAQAVLTGTSRKRNTPHPNTGGIGGMRYRMKQFLISRRLSGNPP
jgi:hypothetical protein